MKEYRFRSTGKWWEANDQESQDPETALWYLAASGQPPSSQSMKENSSNDQKQHETILNKKRPILIPPKRNYVALYHTILPHQTKCSLGTCTAGLTATGELEKKSTTGA